MKRKKIGLYDPYFDTMGGGEKHVLSILQVLEQEAAYDPVVFWDTDLTDTIRERLNLSFRNLRFSPNLFANGTSVVDKLNALRSFEILLYVTDGSYFFSSAHKNFVFCMVPDKHLFTKTMLNWLKTAQSQFIANSQFTQRWLAKWDIRSEVLYPYINQEFLDLKSSDTSKEPMILVAGRFFEHLHSKRQDLAIEAFQRLRQLPGFENYRLILAGSVLPSDQAYLLTLQELAKDEPHIEIRPNIPFTEMLDLYRRASYYWHMTGYGVDDEISPEKVEHLGITPLEAMAAGCIVCCFNAGGPREIIRHGENGFLFNSIDHLLSIMKESHSANLQSMTSRARALVQNNFSYEQFRKRVVHLFTY